MQDNSYHKNLYFESHFDKDLTFIQGLVNKYTNNTLYDHLSRGLEARDEAEIIIEIQHCIRQRENDKIQQTQA